METGKVPGEQRRTPGPNEVMGSTSAKRDEAEAIMDAIGTGDRTVVRDELGEVYLKASYG